MDLNTVEAASDIKLDVQRAPYQKLTVMDGGEYSASIRTRMEAARTPASAFRQARQARPDRQQQRWAAHQQTSHK